jgi:hypothetical protein
MVVGSASTGPPAPAGYPLTLAGKPALLAPLALTFTLLMVWTLDEKTDQGPISRL